MFRFLSRFRSSRRARRFLALAPGFLVVIAVLWASRVPSFAPQGVLPHGGEMLLWSAVGALAALHRPWGGATLGLGTLVLAPVVSHLGALPAALVAGGVFLLSRLALSGARWFLRRLKEVWGFGRTLAQTVPVVGAALVAAATAMALEDRPGLAWALVPPIAYVIVFSLLAPRTRGAAGEHRTALLLDATGWGLGLLLTEAARAAGWEPVVPLVVAIALLSAEAARNGMLRGVSDYRAGDLQRVQEAHARILGETSGMGGIAQQILVECSNVLPVSWYQFELLAAAIGERQSWTSGPDGILRQAEPNPPSYPHMLPGLHRRARWQVIENTLVAEEESLAVVRLWCDPRRVTPGAGDLLASLVPQMASSVHRARLDREAKLDSLTGVPVRRLLESRMQKSFRRSLEESVPMAVIMCDIDFFKKVNDTYGHDAGDQALILVAQTLESQRRENDLCCRYGGEEFTILLEDTGGEAALRLAERLRQAIEELTMEYDGQRISLTLTLGVAAYPELHIKTASELVLLADEALYQGKENGRNRALLNLGWGRYREVSGATLVDQKAAAKAGPPRIFS